MGKIIYNPIILVIFTLVSIVFFMSLQKSAQKTKVSNKSIEMLENEVSNIAIELNNTQKDLEKAQKPLEQEKIIRNELLMQKEGEYVVQLPEVSIDEEESDKEMIEPLDAWWELLKF